MKKPHTEFSQDGCKNGRDINERRQMLKSIAEAHIYKRLIPRYRAWALETKR